MRVVFMGSPQFALPSLRRLIASEHQIVAVYTQPDRPRGRGRKLTPPPVKTLALERGLPVRQPAFISKPDSVEELRALAPDLGIIAAYGQILKQPVLDTFPRGVLNVHASLLPRWRGAAPVAAAILADDAETGATIMIVRLALDAGPILAQRSLPIRGEDTAGTLTERIAEAGAALLMETLPRWLDSSLEAKEQDDALATYAPQLTKGDALIRWERDDAEEIARQVRAYNPSPGAFSYLDGKPLRIIEAVARQHRVTGEPGTVFTFTGVEETSLLGAGFGVVTRDGALGVVTVQPAGGRAMAASAYVKGHREIVGKKLTTER